MDYDRGISVKQALLEYIDGLSDEEARSLWDRIRCDDYEWSKREPLTAEDIATIQKSLDQLDSGQWLSHEEVKQMFGIS